CFVQDRPAASERIKDKTVSRGISTQKDLDQLRRELAVPREQVASLLAVDVQQRLRNRSPVEGHSVKNRLFVVHRVILLFLILPSSHGGGESTSLVSRGRCP